MKTFKKCFSALVFFCLSITTYAASISCPPAYQVKRAVLDKAIHYEEGSDIWEIKSAPFFHRNMAWDVSYGLILRGVSDPKQALLLARTRYPDAPILNPSPQPIDIPGHWFCDYVVAETDYWIQVLSPPDD